MSFTEATKVDIRRFCGYPFFGGSQSAGFQEWRFFQAYGTLEFRMNNLDPAEEAVVTTYLTSLYTLEAAIPAASAGLDTDTAAVFKRNMNEVRDRQRLYNYWRRELCKIFGIPPGPGLAAGAMGLVV